MAVTRIKNNQVTDSSSGNTQVGINAGTKLQDFSITAGKIANNLTYGSDLTVAGNLTVQGNSTAIDTTITTIEDPIIVLASTQTSGAPAVDIGFLGFRGNESNIAFVWDESADSFVTAFTSTGESNTTITITSYANLQVGNLSLTGNILNSTLNVTGNITGGNLLTPGLISATSTITSAANIAGGNVLTGGLISATSTITSAANVTGGNLLTGGLISATSTITTTANITGGNILFGSGQVSGTGNVYATNFIGNISGNIDAAGANTQVQFNDDNLLGASAAFTFDKASNALVNSGNITGGNLLTGGLISATSTITSAANIAGGNITTGGLITATGNITGGNLLTSGSGGAISGSGNITGGNLLTGGAVTATGNITGGNILTAGLISATSTITSAANIAGGNLLTGGLISATSTITSAANITGGNILTAGLISATSTITSAANVTGGNITTAGVVTATGNITGGNLLTPGLISAAGLATSGNVQTAGFVSATGNVIALAVNTATLASSAGITITTLGANGNINLTPNGTGNIVLGGNTYVNGVSLTPVQDNDVASKYYVDTIATTGITIHEAVFAATNTTLATATGGTVTYNQPNGAANGVGATLTTTGSFNLIDTANVQTVGTRILVKDQANAVQNGVYVYSNATVITRSTDTDQYGADSAESFSINDYFFTTGGNVNAGTASVVSAPAGVITFGTSNISFGIFSQSQVYTANTAAGLVLNGTVFSAKVDNNTTAFDNDGNIIVKAGANLTTPNIGAATGASLSATGNIQGGNILTGGFVTATGNLAGGNVTTAGLITATGNITGGNVLTGGLISATSTITSAANITGGNLLTGGLISATSTITSAANITGGNILSGGLGSFTGNVTAANFFGNISGNIDAGGANTNIQFNDSDILNGSAGFTFDKVGNVVTANGNITGANLFTGGTVSATANITGGNILTAGLISATSTITSAANITGGNVLTGGLISATSTITSAANITGGNILTAGLISATSTITSAANITGGNLLTAGLISATSTITSAANITGGNILTAGLVSATSTITSAANVIGGNITTAGLVTATGNITGANLILTTGIIDGPAAGRITINGSDIDTDFAVDGDTVANVFYVDAGTGTASFGASTQVTNAIVNFATTTSIKTPVGNTAQRPGTGVTGMLRFNTTSNALEVYDNSAWSSVGVPVFTVIADEQFAGDGSTVAFTLGSTQTTNSCIVSINGVVQIPTLAYAVAGTNPTCVLTFTEAPASGDVIDVREITTTTSVTSISNSSGNAVVAVSDTAAQVNVTGDLSVSGTILGGNINSTAITSGTSNMSVVSSGGNIRANIAGTTVQTISAGLVAITGDLSVSGNATLSGNILGDRIQNGNTSFDIQTPNGNANINIGGTGNLAVFAPGNLLMTGNITPTANITYDLGTTTNRWKDLWLSNSTIYLGNSQISANATALIFTNPAGGQTVLAGTSAGITGATVSASGNITGGNILTAGLISATGSITTAGDISITGNIVDGAALTISTGSNGNITLAPNGSGVVVVNTDIRNGQANATGNIGATAARFNTVFALATSAQYADLAEKYAADAEYVPGTVVQFGGTAEVTLCVNDACSRVAGVISTNPSYRMNDGLVSEHTAMVALTGRVPTSVTGTVRKGDMMVSAGAGRARAEANPAIGTVIGKALADSEGDAVIEVVVGRV